MLNRWKIKFAAIFEASPILIQEIALNNTESESRAMTLFVHSKLDDSYDNLNRFIVLAEVLANPLCQTIYDARLRSFSSYSDTSDPIDSTFALDLINQLYTEQNKERQVAIFFDACAQFRSYPPTQKYMTDLRVDDAVLMALNLHCLSMIERIDSALDYQQTQQMINKLHTLGGDQALFDQLNYSIATTIETDDLYSQRSYQQLMDEIKEALFKPQVYLSLFTTELKQSKGYTAVEDSLPITQVATSHDTLFNPRRSRKRKAPIAESVDHTEQLHEQSAETLGVRY